MKRLFPIAAVLMVAAALCALPVCIYAMPQAATAPSAPGGFTGTVVETMSTGSYTYVQVDTGSEKIWAAAPAFEVKKGEKVSVPAGSLMKNYHSNSFDRTFEEIYFVGGIAKGDAPPAPAGVHGGMPPAKKPAEKIDFSGIAKPAGGYTVAELFEQQKKLSGKKVTLRGKVVKLSQNIMDKNWFHIQDGTGQKGTNDLTVTTTTDQTAEIGAGVLVTGTLIVDKDFGSGYRYDIILEQATVKPE